jgi:hypothetical protein
MKDLVFKGTRGHNFPDQEKDGSRKIDWVLRAHGVTIFSKSPNKEKERKSDLDGCNPIDRFSLLPYVSSGRKQTDWLIVLACLRASGRSEMV